MRLGDVANEGSQRYGKPLDGVRVLAAEQMQALPYATQLLARLGADVVKVEHPVHGESGRASTPAITDPEGRAVGATYLRNNLGKRSLGLDVIAKRYPRVIYVSISGFGNATDTPYREWPAYASIVEAMSGIYEYKS